MPEIKPERPWYGYDLGEWNADLDIMARRAVRSDYWKTGEIISEYRRNDVEMNTEVRTLDVGNPGVGEEEPNEEIEGWNSRIQQVEKTHDETQLQRFSDHLNKLDQAGLLRKVARPINKDTELHPLVRWQFRGGIPDLIVKLGISKIL